MSAVKTIGKFTAEITVTDETVCCDITCGRHSASLALCEDLGTVGEEPGAPAISQSTLDAFQDFAAQHGY